MRWYHRLFSNSPKPTLAWRPSLDTLDDRLVPTPLTPLYTATFADAVTADNAFTTQGGQTAWTIDAGADEYQNDRYERPTAQTFTVQTAADGSQRFAATEYYQNLDIVNARAGFDAKYLYVSIKMAGLNKVTADGSQSYEGLGYQYGFRIANQTDGGGGLLIVADQPQFKGSPNTAYGQAGTFIYRDANGDVGGTGRIISKQDRPAEVNGNGYDRVLASDGKLGSGKQVLWVRVSPTDPNVVEFALDYKAVGYTTANVANLAYFNAEANKGLKDPGNYLWNDEYTKSEAGSPYRATTGNLSQSEFGTQGLGNIYELDTLDLGSLVAAEPGSIAGIVYADRNRNGVRDAGEDGISDVQLVLSGIDDQGTAVTMTAFTDTDGTYRFADLRPGTYSIQETQPSGYSDGVDTIGSLGGQLFNDDVDGNDQFFDIVLGAGQNGVGYEFGEFYFE